MGRSQVINNFHKKWKKKEYFLTIKDVLRYGSFKLFLLRRTQIIFGCVCNYLCLLLFPARLREFVTKKREKHENYVSWFRDSRLREKVKCDTSGDLSLLVTTRHSPMRTNGRAYFAICSIKSSL